MISLTPTARLEWMLSQSELGDAHSSLRKLIEGYEAFLSNTERQRRNSSCASWTSGNEQSTSTRYYRFGDLVLRLAVVGKNLSTGCWWFKFTGNYPSKRCRNLDLL